MFGQPIRAEVVLLIIQRRPVSVFLKRFTEKGQTGKGGGTILTVVALVIIVQFIVNAFFSPIVSVDIFF